MNTTAIKTEQDSICGTCPSLLIERGESERKRKRDRERDRQREREREREREGSEKGLGCVVN